MVTFTVRCYAGSRTDIPTVRTNIHLSGQVFSATDRAAIGRGGTFTAHRTAGLIFFHGHGGVDVASATCIRIAGRCFLATAGHNLDGMRRDRDIRIVPPRSSRDRWLPFLGRNATRGRHPQSYDVGWIEIDPEVADSAGLRFLDAENLAPRSVAATGDQSVPHETRPRGRLASRADSAPYLIHGLPAGLATHGLHARGRVIHLTLLGYRTSASTTAADSSRRHQLSLRYDRDDQSDPATPAPRHGGLPAAHGLSGGGVWRVDATPGGVSLGTPYLVAIIRSWHRREQRLSSIPVGRWLDLVAHDVPGLRPAIGRLRKRRK